MLKSVLRTSCLWVALVAPAGGQEPSDQSNFDRAYGEIIKRVASLQEQRNQLALHKELDKLRQDEEKLRLPRYVTGWQCRVEEVRVNSASYDSGLKTATKGRTTYYFLVVCSSENVQYFLLYDRSEQNASQLANLEVGSVLTFSGKLGILAKVAEFHSSLLPPTFVVRAN